MDPDATQRKRRKTSNGTGGNAKVTDAPQKKLEVAGTYMPMSGFEPPPVEGISANACVLGLSIPTRLMYPGGSHEMRFEHILPSRKNTQILSLVLWLLQACLQANITVYLESVIDYETYATLGEIIQLRLRVFVPLDQGPAAILLSEMQSMLERDSTSPPPLPTSGAACSSHCISSATSFLNAIEACRSGARGTRPLTLSFASASQPPDEVDLEDETYADTTGNDSDANAMRELLGLQPIHPAEGPDGTYAAPTSYAVNCPLSILDMKHMDDASVCRTDLTLGARQEQMNISEYYVQNSMLKFPLFSCGRDDGPRLVYTLTPDICKMQFADELLKFSQPLNQPTAPVLKQEMIKAYRYASRDIPDALLTANTVDAIERAITEDSEATGYNRLQPSLMEAPCFPHARATPRQDQYPHAHEAIWAVQTAVMYSKARLLHLAYAALKAGKIDNEKCGNLVCNELNLIEHMTTSKVPGVNPCFALLQENVNELSSIIENPMPETDLAAASKAIFEFVPKTGPHGCRMNFLHRVFSQLTSLAATRLNLTLAQTVAFLPIWVSGCCMLRNEFGLQVAWLMIGPPDTGKSWAASVVLLCTPGGLKRQSHKKSLNVLTKNQKIAFNWVDEQFDGIENASTKKGGEVSQATMLDQSCKALGYGANSRFMFARDGHHYVQDEMSEQRCIEIAGSNLKLTAAQISRKNTLFMVAGSKDNGVTPTRQECTVLHGTSVNTKGVPEFFQLQIAYANLLWLPHAFGMVPHVCTASILIFNAMVNAMLVPVGFDAVPPRKLNQLRSQSLAVMTLRLSREWETQEDRTLKERNAGRSLFAMSNMVLHMGDVYLAWGQLTHLSDTRHEEAQILATLKGHIKCDTTCLDISFLECQQNKAYYQTSINGVVGLAAALPGLGLAVSKTLTEKLKFNGLGSMAPILEITSGDERGMFAVSKEAVDNPNCIAPGEQAIINLLSKVVSNQIQGDHGVRLWYPAVDSDGNETGEIIFKRSVRDAILSPGIISTSNEQLRAELSACSSEVIQTGYAMLNKSQCLSHEDQGNQELSIWCAHPQQIGPDLKRATRHGMLDEYSVMMANSTYRELWEQLEKKHKDDPAALDEAEVDFDTMVDILVPMPHLASSDNPKRVPNTRPMVGKIQLHGCLRCSAKMHEVMHYVSVGKYLAMTLEPPPLLPQEAKMDKALKRFLAAIYAISGEDVGERAYTGTSAMQIMTLEDIETFDESITIKNPRRRDTQYDDQISNQSINDDDPLDAILPPDQPTVTLRAGDNITDILIRNCRQRNTPFL